MRSAFALLLLVALSAFARTNGLDRVSVSGSDYIRLHDWCDLNEYSLKWNRSQGDIDLQGEPRPIRLAVDSRKAEIGGVTVWLSLPVVNHNGSPCISLIDLRTALEPLLFPRKDSNHIATICIDPGHGGKDTGKIAGSNYEKKYTLLLAHDVQELLREDGFKVVLTRDRDVTVELDERIATAVRHHADLFVSLHYNAAPESSVRGLEVYCLAPPGVNASNDGGGKSTLPAQTGNDQDAHNILLAYEMQKTLTQTLPLEDRGIKRSHFKVLREARMPAILIEGGYMTSPLDAKNIYDSTFRRRMARAIVNALLAYRHITGR